MHERFWISMIDEWRVEWLHAVSDEAEFGFGLLKRGVSMNDLIFFAADRQNMTEPRKGAILYLEPFVTVHWSDRMNLIYQC